MKEFIYQVGKKTVSIVGGLLVAEAICICGNALISDVVHGTDAMKKIIATPEAPRGGFFGKGVK